MRPLKLVLRLTLSLAMSAFFVWLSLRRTDVRAVAAAIASVSPWAFLAYVPLLLAVHLVRTIRWGILLEPLGHVSFKRLNSATAVGFMLLMLLPLRLGDFARPLLIARPPPGGGKSLSRTGALASIVVERIADGIFIGLLGVVSLHFLGENVGGGYVAFARRASWIVTAGFFGLCVALVLALLFRERALRLVALLLSPASPRLSGRATAMLDTFISALHLGSGWKVLGFFALTALFWGLSALGLGLVAPAFGFHGLTPLMLCVILTFQVVGVMVPAGPGMVGTLQFFTQAGLSLFVAGAFSDPHAAAFANFLWLLQFGQQVLLGLVFLLIGHVSLKGLFGPALAPPESPRAEAAAAP